MIRLLILFSLLANIALGQDTIKKKTKEYYLSIAGFSPLNIQIKYKKQIGQKTFFKLGLVNISGAFSDLQPNNSTAFPSKTSNLSGGLQIGIEFRKQLTDKFTFFHGPNLNYVYSISKTLYLNPAIPQREQINISERHTGSIPYTLGLLFNMSKHVLIAVEINPSINISQSNSKYGNSQSLNPSYTNINFMFDNNYALLSIVYRL